MYHNSASFSGNLLVSSSYYKSQNSSNKSVILNDKQTVEMSTFGDLVHLNVGGHRFSTSRQTLTVVPDTFFTALLSGRIPALQVN